MITADKARRFAERARTKTRGSIDIVSAIRKAEADLTRDIRRAADLGEFRLEFRTRTLSVAEVLASSLKTNGYKTGVRPGPVRNVVTADWSPDL